MAKPKYVILQAVAAQPQYNSDVILQLVYFISIYAPDLPTLSLSDSVSYGLGMKSVWTFALTQSGLVYNRSSSILRLSLLLEHPDPLVIPPLGTADKH